MLGKKGSPGLDIFRYMKLKGLNLSPGIAYNLKLLRPVSVYWMILYKFQLFRLSIPITARKPPCSLVLWQIKPSEYVRDEPGNRWWPKSFVIGIFKSRIDVCHGDGDCKLLPYN